MHSTPKIERWLAQLNILGCKYDFIIIDLSHDDDNELSS